MISSSALARSLRFIGTMKPRLRAASASALLSDLAAIDITVPGRTEGRRSHHRETWSICRFLSSFAPDPLLSYPLRLEPGEAPDFTLSMGATTVGIEITEATHPDYGWACARAEKDPDAVLEPDMFKPGTKLPKRRGLKPHVGRIDQPLVGEGWRGYEVEQNWSQFVHESVIEKTALLSNPKFSCFDQKWLLIYDNTPTNLLKVPQALAFLNAALGDYFRQPVCFHQVIVDVRKAFVRLDAHGSHVLPLNNLWP
jgi:hypothetical protein